MRTHIKFLACLLLFSYFTSTAIFWNFEHGVNPHIKSFGDVLWWWMVTSSTVGYGDVFPITIPGRCASVLAIIIGIYTYTNFVTLSADKIHETLESHKRGTAKVKCHNHLVICEYTAFADELIQELSGYDQFNDKDVVIVSDLVSTNPYPQHSFVCGVPINPSSLKKANVETADHIFIFANSRFRDPDLKTLHVLSRIKKINKHATIYIELTNPDTDIVKHMLNSTNPIIILDSDRLLEFVLLKDSIDLNYFINAYKLEKNQAII
jgi:voltage-gated potassium channel